MLLTAIISKFTLRNDNSFLAFSKKNFLLFANPFESLYMY